MQIAAVVNNTPHSHTARVRTEACEQSIDIASKPTGGSAINGGELMMLALATCYCNDLYREAKRLGISLDAVEVYAQAEFPGVGLAAKNITYRATITCDAAPDLVARLILETDAVAEVHNTLRAGTPVTLDASRG